MQGQRRRVGAVELPVAYMKRMHTNPTHSPDAMHWDRGGYLRSSFSVLQIYPVLLSLNMHRKKTTSDVY